jgi:triacylglycerol lipase
MRRGSLLAAAALGAGALGVATLGAAPLARSQVPPDLVAANRAIGKANDQPATAKVYGPLAEKPPYAEAKITRDLSYGPAPENRLDVFQPAAGGRPRAVIIYVSGGTGMRTSGDKNLPTAGAFYDNIMLWAAKHDMVGVNTDRRFWKDRPWDTGARDVAGMVGWVRANIARYGGDPNRIFLFGHGYGGSEVTTYLAHPEFWDGGAPGVTGAILISAPFNIAPVMGPPGARAGLPMFDPAHSNLEGLKASKTPLYLGSAEFDEDATRQSADLLRQELCRRACPGYGLYKDHQHISVTYSFNTADESVSGPVLDWIRGVR